MNKEITKACKIKISGNKERDCSCFPRDFLLLLFRSANSFTQCFVNLFLILFFENVIPIRVCFYVRLIKFLYGTYHRIHIFDTGCLICGMHAKLWQPDINRVHGHLSHSKITKRTATCFIRTVCEKLYRNTRFSQIILNTATLTASLVYF